jgi:uncharacterized membrane protein
MSVEMATVAFDGTHTAEQELSGLRTSRADAWLTDVAVLEHHKGGRFSMKATSPDYGDEDHIGAGIAIGGGTGLLLGMIAGPLGILFWAAVGGLAGGAAGASSRAGAFDPLVDQVKDALPHGTSALILVAESATAEELVTAVGARGRQVLRQTLTDEQVDQLKQAAARTTEAIS